MAYIGRQQDGFGVRSRFIYTATSGQTTFTTDDSSNALSYSDGAYVDVYLNGVLLDPSDYTATSLTSIVLDSGAAASDILEVIVYDVFSVFSGTFTNGITASEATITNGISAGSATVTGDLTVDTSTLKVDSTNNRVLIGNTSSIGTTIVGKVQTSGTESFITTNNEVGGFIGVNSNSDNSLAIGADPDSDRAGSHIAFYVDGLSEKMRIDSSGNVGIGTNTVSEVLHLHRSSGTVAAKFTDDTSGTGTGDGFEIGKDSNRGGFIWNYESSDNYFGTNNTERMRISATSPALSIGKTTFGTAGQGFTVYGNTVPQCYFNKSHSGAVNGVLFYHSDSYVGGLNYTNTATSLATSSDERLKDNIENSDDAGAKIDAMQVRQFDWKSTGEHQEYGFVAQELEPVFAHAVHTDIEDDYKGVDYACLVPILVKEIQSLRQRITDLENA